VILLLNIQTKKAAQLPYPMAQVYPSLEIGKMIF